MKKKLLLIFMLTSVSMHSQQQDPISDYKDYIENELMIGENKLAPHSSFTSFTSKKEALNKHSEFYKSLDGKWNFNWVKNWIDRHFFNKGSDTLLGIIFISCFVALAFKFYSKTTKKSKIKTETFQFQH